MWEVYASMCSKLLKYICQNISRGPEGHPGGPNGPAAVLQGTRGGATWKYTVSQNPAVLDQIFCRTLYPKRPPGVPATKWPPRASNATAAWHENLQQRVQQHAMSAYDQV